MNPWRRARRLGPSGFSLVPRMSLVAPGHIRFTKCQFIQNRKHHKKLSLLPLLPCAHQLTDLRHFYTGIQPQHSLYTCVRYLYFERSRALTGQGGTSHDSNFPTDSNKPCPTSPPPLDESCANSRLVRAHNCGSAANHRRPAQAVLVVGF